MDLALPFLVGALVAAGLYMMMRRSTMKLLIGLALLSHGGNLLIFTAAGPSREGPPIIPEGETHMPHATADPVAQALILTAIVISFGVLAFSVALIYRCYTVTQTDDLDDLTITEE